MEVQRIISSTLTTGITAVATLAYRGMNFFRQIPDACHADKIVYLFRHTVSNESILAPVRACTTQDRPIVASAVRIINEFPKLQNFTAAQVAAKVWALPANTITGHDQGMIARGRLGDINALSELIAIRQYEIIPLWFYVAAVVAADLGLEGLAERSTFHRLTSAAIMGAGIVLGAPLAGISPVIATSGYAAFRLLRTPLGILFSTVVRPAIAAHFARNH